MNQVKKLIIQTARCLGLDILANDMENNSTLGELDTQYKNGILTAINNAIKALSISEVVFSSKITIHVTDGDYNLSILPYRLYRIISLKSNNVDVDFDYHGVRLNVMNGTYDLEYRYIPDELSEGDDLPDCNLPLERILVYGASTEFCLKHGRFSDAWNYRKAYELELDVMKKNAPLKNTMIKKKVWA